ncbi:MAG: glycosyltransferase family 39 protein [Anaerolineae bacterium]
MRVQQQNSWMWLVPILLLATLLGSWLLTYDAIWFDEWITYFMSNTGRIGADTELYGVTTVEQMPVCQDVLSHQEHTILHTLCIVAIDNSWPPLFFLLLMGWDVLVGGVLYVDRIFALFIGLLGISLTYRMASVMISRRVGLIASLLLGTLVFYTFYMHEVRGYTLYATLPALNGWLYWRLHTRPESVGRGTRWGFVLSIIATLYTHYIGIAVVFGIGLYHVLFARPRQWWQGMRQPQDQRPPDVQHWLSLLKLIINASLTYGLWIGVLYISLYNESLNPRSLPLSTLLWTMLRGFSNNLWWLALLAIGLSLVRWRDEALRFLWVWGLSILAVAMVANLVADFLFHPRHIIGLLPIFVTLTAIGLVEIARRTHALVLVGLLALWVGAGAWYSLTPDFMNGLPEHVDAVPLSVMQPMVNTAETCGTASDTFIFAWNEPDEEWAQDHMVTYYLHGTPVSGVTISRILNEDENRHTTHLIPETIFEQSSAVRYDYFVQDAERVFVFERVEADLSDAVQEIETRLARDGFTRCEYLNNTDLRSAAFVRAGASCEAVQQTCQP